MPAYSPIQEEESYESEEYEMDDDDQICSIDEVTGLFYDDEILWGDDPNRNYAAYFIGNALHDKGRDDDDSTLGEVLAKPSRLQLDTHWDQMAESRASVSLAGRSMDGTPASGSLAGLSFVGSQASTSPYGVPGVLRPLPEERVASPELPVAINQEPSQENPAIEVALSTPGTENRPGREANVPSVIYVGDTPQKLVRVGDADVSFQGNQTVSTNARRLYNRKTFIILLMLLAICILAFSAAVLFIVLRERQRDGTALSEAQSQNTLGTTAAPLRLPTLSPTLLSFSPSEPPSLSHPIPSSDVPSLRNSAFPSDTPSLSPTTTAPTSSPSGLPSMLASEIPSASSVPTVDERTNFPSISPSQEPSVEPTTVAPSDIPTREPSTTSPTTLTPSVSPTLPPSDPPTRKPTNAPTPLPFAPSTLAPDIDSALFDFFVGLSSHDQGAALNDSSSPQFRALQWLSQDPKLSRYSESKMIQRFALATFFYSTGAESWTYGWNWVSDNDECTWYSRSKQPCDENGVLRELDMYNNNMAGTIPIEVSWLSALLRINLRENNIYGTLPSQLGRLKLLRFLQLTRNAITGTLPSELGLVSTLEVMGMGRNQMTGTLPTEYAALTSLTTWGLERNGFSSTIPPQYGSMVGLRLLALDNNNFTGRIPSSLGDLAFLNTLSINDNGFTGIMPNQICSRFLRPFIRADCNEIECSCCSECCDPDLGCA